jgi:hypothetical protein
MATPARKARKVLLVPGLQVCPANTTSQGYALTFPRDGTVVRALFGTAAVGASSEGVRALEAKVSIGGGQDLFSDGRAAEFCNVGLLTLPVNSNTGPSTVGGAGIDLWQRVKGAQVWTFTVKNISLSDDLYPRIAVIFEED